MIFCKDNVFLAKAKKMGSVFSKIDTHPSPLEGRGYKEGEMIGKEGEVIRTAGN